MKVFFDSNVIIDALTRREGAVEEERDLLYAAMAGKIDGILSAKQLTDIYYVLRKYIKEDETRRDLLSILIQGLEIVPVDRQLLTCALGSNVPDYEDALIAECAKVASVDFIVTNDTKGFKDAGITTILPNEAIKRIGVR